MESIEVAVRLRPLNEEEINNNESQIWEISQNSIIQIY